MEFINAYLYQLHVRSFPLFLIVQGAVICFRGSISCNANAQGFYGVAEPPPHAFQPDKRDRAKIVINGKSSLQQFHTFAANQ